MLLRVLLEAERLLLMLGRLLLLLVLGRLVLMLGRLVLPALRLPRFELPTPLLPRFRFELPTLRLLLPNERVGADGVVVVVLVRGCGAVVVVVGRSPVPRLRFMPLPLLPKRVLSPIILPASHLARLQAWASPVC